MTDEDEDDEDVSCLQVSRSGRQTAAEFPLVPSLLSVTEDEKILIAGTTCFN